MTQTKQPPANLGRFNRLNQIWRQERQAEEFPQEGPVDLLGRRQFGQRSMATVVEQALVSVRASHRLHKRRVAMVARQLSLHVGAANAVIDRLEAKRPRRLARAIAHCARGTARAAFPPCGAGAP